jgi:hypothetical protein
VTGKVRKDFLAPLIAKIRRKRERLGQQGAAFISREYPATSAASIAANLHSIRACWGMERILVGALVTTATISILGRTGK